MNIIERLRLVSDNVYELCVPSGYDITAKELMDLGRAGYVYYNDLAEVDYDDINDEGKECVRYMDIYYFSYTDPNVLHAKQEL